MSPTPLSPDSAAPSAPTHPLLAWWSGLANDRAGRAALRRAVSVDEVWTIPAFGRLWRATAGDRRPPPEIQARIAMAIAELDEDGPRLGEALARPPSSKGLPLSPTRLRLLVDNDEADTFLRFLRSALEQCGRRANVVDTATLMRRWHQPASRAKARRDIVLTYFDHVDEQTLKKAEA